MRLYKSFRNGLRKINSIDLRLLVKYNYVNGIHILQGGTINAIYFL